VDFPEPLGPISPMNSILLTEKPTFFNTGSES
jgi:hypothetical protein